MDRFSIGAGVNRHATMPGHERSAAAVSALAVCRLGQPLTLVAVAALLFGVALAASLIPAWRATRVHHVLDLDDQPQVVHAPLARHMAASRHRRRVDAERARGKVALPRRALREFLDGQRLAARLECLHAISPWRGAD